MEIVVGRKEKLSLRDGDELCATGEVALWMSDTEGAKKLATGRREILR